jgi:hypothetical protein
LALRLPVDAVEIRTTSWRSTGSRWWSSMAAGEVATASRWRLGVERLEVDEDDGLLPLF